MSRPELGDQTFKKDFLNQDRGTVDQDNAGTAFSDRSSALQAFDQETSSSNDFLRFVSAADEQMLAGQMEQARRLYFAALREPHMEGEVLFNVYKNLGNISMHAADLDGAEEYYNKAFTMNPDSDVLMVNFGSLAVQRQQMDVAVRRFRRAVEINRRNEKAWMGLSIVHREFGDAELAWANIESALDINPGNSTAIRLVADWAMKDNQLERGIRLLEPYLKLHPKDALIHMMLGKFYYFFARLEMSLFHIKKSLELEPGIEDGSEIFAVVQAEMTERQQQFSGNK